MSEKNFKILLIVFLVTGSLYFVFIGLTSGKDFLIPIVTAVILAMVMAPVSAKFREWGVKKVWAVFFSDLVVVAFIAFMIFLFADQANQVADNWSQIENRIKPKVEQAQNYFRSKLSIASSVGGEQQYNNNQQQEQQPNQNQDHTGEQQQQNNQQEQLPRNRNHNQKNQSDQQLNQQKHSQQQQSYIPEDSQQAGKNNQNGSFFSFSPQSIKSKFTDFVKNIFSILSKLLLVLIYIFFFLYYSKKFRDTLIGMVKEEKREKANKILDKITKTAQQYLFGRFILIFILAVLYAIGWSILGLKYALFISVIAAVFSLIPYIGNLVGLVLAISMSFLTGDNGGGAGQIIAIVAIFSVVQFIESYILEPFVVGHEVDVNPVVIIVGVVLGGIVWGIMGMVLSIPILGIIKVVFDNIASLRPLGYALDERGVSSGGGKQDKIKKWFKKKAKQAGIIE